MNDELLRRLDEVIEAEIEPNAISTDVDGRFPTANLDALGRSGLLGLISGSDVGGTGAGLESATRVVRAIAEHCSSTAMIVTMHYAATAVLEAHGSEEVRRQIASGEHLSTLAFSEKGSRSHFWAPLSTATVEDDSVRLDAKKSWITGAGFADSYVWSSLPASADGMSSLWYVPSTTTGLKVDSGFDGLGLRGNASSPVSAADAVIPADHRLGTDGGGFDIMMSIVLPWFTSMNAAMSVGLMNAAVERSAAHLSSTRLEHLGTTLAEDPVKRLQLAQAKVRTDQAAALLDRSVAAIEAGAEDATLRVLEVKASAADAAIEVTDACMRLCGGSAFRREVGVERLFRDARAAAVMAPTSDALYDFIGKALCGLPVF